MDKKNILFGICLFLIFIIADNANSAQDRIIAIVNEDIITESDIKEYLGLIYLQLSQDIEDPKELKKIMENLNSNAVNQLIEDKLIIQEAKRQKIEIKDEQINSRIEDFKHNVSPDQNLDELLASDGLTLTDVKNKIKNQFLMREIIEKEVRLKIFVHPSEVTAYYEGHKEDFLEPERVDLDSIFISIKDSSIEKAKIVADEVLKLAKGGQNFLELTEKYSQAPSIGLVKRGQLKSEIEVIVFSLESGYISKVVKTDVGFFIFRLKQKFPSQQKELSQVKDEINKIIFQQKFEKLFLEWIERLKKNAYIKIK